MARLATILLLIVSSALLCLVAEAQFHRMMPMEDAPITTRDQAKEEPGYGGWNPTRKRPKAARKPAGSTFGNGMPSNFGTAGMKTGKKKSANRHPEDEFAQGDFDNLPTGETQYGSKQGPEAKCVSASLRVCPLRLMHENFAAFTRCVYDQRLKWETSCQEWAEQQGSCLDDMGKHCQHKDPLRTSECLAALGEKLSTQCTNSPFYTSLIQGIDGMKARTEGRPEFTQPTGGMPDFMNEGGGMPGGEGGMPGMEDMMGAMGGGRGGGPASHLGDL